MRHKTLVTTKIDQISNTLTVLDSFISTNRPPRELKEHIEKVREKLADIQTLINNESESWN